MDRPPAPLSPLVMPLGPPFPLRITTGWASPIFVYNVAHQQFDRILVCTETPAESIDTQLLKALAEVAAVVEIVTYE